MIDHALSLVAAAVKSVIRLEDYVGPQEGQILRRHDYRIDIDNDEINEIIALLEFGPSFLDGYLSPRIAPVIIKKTEQGYRRIPAESIPGSATYGSVSLKTINVTNAQFPDLFIHRSQGMSSSYSSLLRRKGNGYVLARREIVEGVNESWMPSGDGGFLSHYRQEFRLADFDGDGLVEIIQYLQFDLGSLANMGYVLEKKEEGAMPEEGVTPIVCRVIKWDPDKELLVQTEERFIIEDPSLIPHFPWL